MRLKIKYLTLQKLATTTTALTAAENKTPNVTNLVKKSDYNTKTTEIGNEINTDRDHDKYITSKEFNKLKLEHFTARLAHANLVLKMILLIS